MKKLLLTALVLLLVPVSFLQAQVRQKTYTYDTIPGDPLRARIYTLDNGLKVYLSVYKDEPRFQSFIGVKAGSKNDPSDHTGLAHYLEHMLFKGTDKYGTNDYAKEAPLLDTIFNLYDRYGATTDSMKRVSIYHQIDSVSGVAANYAIANEFDKMMAGIGVTGVNAYTSVEQTVYQNDVPSNQLENFLNIEAERFRHPVMRLFHTELEAVYEEKNRGLDNDGRKMYEALMSGIFQHHQYGTQTTIGTIEHLKNPSLKEIRKFLETYYVPNNMVISLSGDFNPDDAIRLIDERFGKMAKKEVPAYQPPSENLIKQPIFKEVYGPDAESVMMGFRFNGANSPDADMITMVDMILSNGQAGLLDLNLNTAQKVLSSSSSTNIMKDYSIHILSGRPREGQTLEQVRDLLLSQIMEIKMGNFPDWLIPAIVTNLRLEQATSYESNFARAQAMLNSELDGVKYKDQVDQINRLSRINKQQVIDFVRTWYGENYVIVYKRTGEDKNVIKVVKPPITPVQTNTEQQSDFVKSVFAFKAPDVQPVFIDYQKDITRLTLKSGVPVFRVMNNENKTFEMDYVFNQGTANNRQLSLALDYLKYLGSAKFTASRIKEEFYKIGCDFNVSTSEDETTVTLSGLSDNFTTAVSLFEDLLSSPQPDTTALSNLKDDVLKRRQNAKLNKNIILGAMQNYAKFGPVSPFSYVLSEQELDGITAQQLTSTLKNLEGYVHRIDYYGPAANDILVSTLDKFHKTPKLLQQPPAAHQFVEQSTDTARVFIVNYDMKQAELVFLSKGGRYDKNMAPQVALYNRYFGGSMASPVFQTLRESKALAYSVSSRYNSPSMPQRSYYNFAYIGTQVDKLPEATAGMMDLLRNFPESEKGFENARDGVIQQIQTERITKGDILDAFHRAEKMGLTYDIRKDIYAQVPKLTLADIRKFHDTVLKNGNYHIVVLGNRKKLDMKTLESYGAVTDLTLTDIFGY